MKNSVLLLSHLFVTSLAAAQVQYGQVRLQNSGKVPIAGVQIIFVDAVPTISDNAGKFKLLFRDKKPGDLIFNEKIFKTGYELVNGAELEVLRIGNTDALGRDIILAKAGDLEIAKKKYYAISDKALTAGFEQQKKALREELTKAKLDQEAFIEQFKEIQTQYETQKKNLDVLAAKFARLNFDDVSQLYREALALFEKGNIEGALQNLKESDLIARANKIIREEERLGEAQTVLTKQKQENQQRRTETIQALQFQAELSLLQAELTEVEAVYDQLLRLDSGNLDMVEQIAKFYFDRNEYRKAIHAYSLLIAHPQAQKWRKTVAYGRLVELCISTNDLPGAVRTAGLNHGLSLVMHQEMQEKDRVGPYTNIYTDWYLAESFRTLGIVNEEMGKPDSALVAFQRADQLLKQAHATYPQDLLIARSLINVYQALGSLYIQLDSIETATKIFADRQQLAQAILLLDPESWEAMDNLASSFIELGNAQFRMGNLEEALQHFLVAAKQYTGFCESQPEDIWLKGGLAKAYLGLGDTNGALDSVDLAFIYYSEFHRLTEELYQGYPQNAIFKENLAIASAQLGNIHTKLGNVGQALQAYEEYHKLTRELYLANPQSWRAKEVLANSVRDLAQSSLDSIGLAPRALAQFGEAAQLYAELVQHQPHNQRHRADLSAIHQDIGDVYLALAQPTQAIAQYEASYRLAQELVTQADPKESYLYELGIILDKLVYTLEVMGNYGQAYHYALELVTLAKTSPLDRSLPGMYGDAAWYALFNKQFGEAEKYAQLGLAIEPSLPWLQTNLIWAYLFQGKFEQARKNFRLVKAQAGNRPTVLEETCLSDLQKFAKAGITHPDVKKFTELLTKK